MLFYSVQFASILWIQVISAQWSDIVETVADINDPVGVEYGSFNGDSGLFVSSFELHDVFFFTLEQLNSYSPIHHRAPVKIVSGGEHDIDIDGSFEVASFQDPSRMVYDSRRDVLFVASRGAMTIREVHFESRTVSTVSDSSGNPISFALSGLWQTNEFPGLDVQMGGSSDLLFVANAKKIFRVKREGSNEYSSKEYESLGAYFENKNYPYDGCNIFSVAPDSKNSVLYVTMSEAKNVILRVPYDSISDDSMVDISVITGQEHYTWGGLGTDFPRVINGANNGATLAMPMHLEYDASSNRLYLSEGVPVMEGVMLGSLMLRQVDLSDSQFKISWLAGVDATESSRISEDSYLGSTGDYEDGPAVAAAFKYPISIDYAYSSNIQGVLSPVIYIADRWNNAVRRFKREDFSPGSGTTPFPSQAPSISRRPTKRPSLYPTHADGTFFPSRMPTVTIAPTSMFRPSPMPSEPDPPGTSPTPRPTHIHAIVTPTILPTRVPTNPVPVVIRYEDQSAFGNTFGTGNGGLDIFLATVLGLLLAAALIMCLLMKERRDRRREKRKKNIVMRLDDDEDDDSDSDDGDLEGQSVTSIIRPSSLIGGVKHAWESIKDRMSEGSGNKVKDANDNDSDASSVHSDAMLLKSSSSGYSSLLGKKVSGLFKSSSNIGSPDRQDLDSLPRSSASGSITSMLQKLKISKRPNSQNHDFVTSTDVADLADTSKNGLMSDYSEHSPRSNVVSPGSNLASFGESGIQMYDRSMSRGSSSRSATGIAESSVTRGRGRADYL